MDVSIRHVSQEISQYVLIRIHNKHTQVGGTVVNDEGVAASSSSGGIYMCKCM
jgi:hypothetical protein